MNSHEHPRGQRSPARHTEDSLRRYFGEADVTLRESTVQDVQRRHDEQRDISILR
ncbi:MAG TPA: hypothetical protein VJU84_03750 [Pyrinomonadaceae bacterium]|nr:hypothetical protein [Pyrinomonadaceae bacterium]